MNENKTSIPVKQIFKIGILAANFALMLMLFDTKEEVRALQQETTRLEEGIKILLETKKMELEENQFHKVHANGSIAHITAIFGLTLAGLVVQDIYTFVSPST